MNEEDEAERERGGGHKMHVRDKTKKLIIGVIEKEGRGEKREIERKKGIKMK